jgi:two-component system NtrC family sensor kinase
MKFSGLLFFVLLLGFKSVAQPPQQPVFTFNSDTTTAWFLDERYCWILPDKNAAYTIDDIRKTALKDSFQNLSRLVNTGNNNAEVNWLRFSIKNDMDKPYQISFTSGALKADFYIVDSSGKVAHRKTGMGYDPKERDGIKLRNQILHLMGPKEQLQVYLRRYGIPAGLYRPLRIQINDGDRIVKQILNEVDDRYYSGHWFKMAFFTGLLLMAAFFNFFFFLTVKDKVYLYFSLFLFFIALSPPYTQELYLPNNYYLQKIYSQCINFAVFFLVQFFRTYFQTAQTIPKWDKVIKFSSFLIFADVLIVLFMRQGRMGPINSIGAFVILLNSVLLTVVFLLLYKRSGKSGKFFLFAIAPFLFSICLILLAFIIGALFSSLSGIQFNAVLSWLAKYADSIIFGSLGWSAVVFTWALFNSHAEQRETLDRQAIERERMAKEKEIERNELIAAQKIELEKQVVERTGELKRSLEELQSTQSQLIQREKMASLGELTAGIAHEIQNPLNFVNNFSEVNKELLLELKEGIQSGRMDDINDLTDDLIANEEKINLHGKRADSIVKSMLQHSRSGAGQKEPADINSLAEEFLRLAYHGLKAKDKSFNAKIETSLDPSLPPVNIVAQDIGRVFLNLFNNAFYAVIEKAKVKTPGYDPLVKVSTSANGNKLCIEIADNGIGIREDITDKIFQPFYTTKPTGQGTGLGLSLSYDIITKGHGGELAVQSTPGEGAVFFITLPF